MRLAYTFDKPRKSRADYDLRHRYGITLKAKQQRWDAQGGLCDLCQKPLSTNLAECPQDHNHKNGQIRGLVHRMCNLIIAALEDNPAIISQGSQYLRRWDGA